MKKLKFVSMLDGDGPQTIHEFELSRNTDHKPIIQWYGAFCAGDFYDVFVDGIKQDLDLNGEIDKPTIDWPVSNGRFALE